MLIIAIAQNLELGLEKADKVVSPESLFPFANLTFVLFSLYFTFGVALILFLFFKKKGEWVPPIFLQDFPISAKAAIALSLLAYGHVHILALIDVYLITKTSFKSASEYFFYMKLPKLLATSHAHFFGHATMYLVTSLIFIFSKLREFWKLGFISLAMSAGLLDVPSWWAIKYGGAQYEFFSGLAGIMSIIGWGGMAIRINYELWWIEIFGRQK
ncbi:MAG: hypothetical protein K2Q18_16895 [Bdellovibrionales bacterium]|nr:hypothetical protein [Bdellovibrionales bacterium]